MAPVETVATPSSIDFSQMVVATPAIEAKQSQSGLPRILVEVEGHAQNIRIPLPRDFMMGQMVFHDIKDRQAQSSMIKLAQDLLKSPKAGAASPVVVSPIKAIVSPGKANHYAEFEEGFAGPFHAYLSRELRANVLEIYYLRRVAFDSEGEDRSKSSSLVLEQFMEEEGDTYPFVGGMQIKVVLDEDGLRELQTAIDKKKPTNCSPCSVM